MQHRQLAHLSDLHLGRSPSTDRRAEMLVSTLLDAGIDHVVVTGDITHRGMKDELEIFRRIFRPLLDRGMVTVVPGNHDRLGDDLRPQLMPHQRVFVEKRPGLYLVQLDSTGPHNRSWLNSQGIITEADIEAVVGVLAAAPPDTLTALLLHHHLLPQPHDHTVEWLTTRLGFWFCDEVHMGAQLLEAIRGRCDLVLHGHRHTPGTATLFQDDRRPVSVYNAGSSTQLGHVRVFEHAQGQLLESPRWLRGVPGMAARFREHVAIPVPQLM